MRLAVPVLLAAVLLTACNDDAATPAASTASPPALPDVSAEATAPASAAPTTAAPTVAFRAGTAADTSPASGGPLTVTAVRAASQKGYDRVVLELKGKTAGTPGWKVQYVDQPTAEGSGEKVSVAGAAVLRVVVTGVGYPFDTGQTEASKDLTPTGLALVREVDLQATYEGEFTAFVGLTRKAPFRVFRLADPARVVIDVRTG